MREITNKKELDSCTFKPSVMGATKRYTLATRKSPQARTSDFALKKKIDEQKALQVKKEEYRKEKQECTFKPDMRKSIGSFKPNSISDVSYEAVPGAKK